MSRTASRLLAAALCMAAAASLSADTFSYAGDTMSTSLSEGREHAILRGNARVETEDMRITASEIELFGKDFIYALCRGSVHVVDARRGIELRSTSWKGVAEEASEAYKDVDEVVRVSHDVGLGRLVARVVPVGVMKG